MYFKGGGKSKWKISPRQVTYSRLHWVNSIIPHVAPVWWYGRTKTSTKLDLRMKILHSLVGSPWSHISPDGPVDPSSFQELNQKSIRMLKVWPIAWQELLCFSLIWTCRTVPSTLDYPDFLDLWKSTPDNWGPDNQGLTYTLGTATLGPATLQQFRLAVFWRVPMCCKIDCSLN